MQKELEFNKQPHPRLPEEYDLCSRTGLHFYKRAKMREYTENYFLEEFKNQYKKTYYEDEPNLRKLAQKRLSILMSFLNPVGKSLLEVGCAAGFFLDEAAKLGFQVKGIEISQKEVEYARNLGHSVDGISFLEYQPKETFDVLAAFFVIEHFQDQELVLTKIRDLIKKDGYLFLALPSLYGPSYLTNPDDWFSNHPGDHFVDYSPSSLKSVLEMLGFQICFREPMSFHPQRDRGWRGRFPTKYFYRVLARWSCYGDTMQILAKKII